MAFTIDYDGTNDGEVASALLKGIVCDQPHLTVEINNPTSPEPDTITGYLVEVDGDWLSLGNRQDPDTTSWTKVGTASVLAITITTTPETV